MDIRTEIFNCIEKGKILVFPKEISARSYLTAYVKENPGKAVFSDSVMSWDTFRDSLKSAPETGKCAETIHRYLFADNFFNTEQSEKLRYFANPECSENRMIFVKNIADNLTHFKKAEEYGTDARILEDVHIVLKAYENFLSENNLYEREFLKPDFSVADKEKYVLVFPGTSEDFEIDKAVQLGFRVIDTDCDTALNGINVYDNSLCEIRESVRSIFEILKTEKACDVTITLNQFDSYLPYLKSECEKRAIKLNVQQGRTLNSFGCGKFFSGIQALYNSGFDFDNLKTFLLNPVFPFRDRPLITDVIRLGIKYRIAESASLWDEKLSRITDKEDIEPAQKVRRFISDLTSSVHKFARCKNADGLRNAFHEFQDIFFEKDSWHTLENETERGAFERAISTIDELDLVMNDCNVKETKDFLNLFIMLLSSVTYTSNKKQDGIKVYSYPQTRGLAAKYHFVLGLSDSAVQQERKKLPFVTSVDNGDSDFITDAVLRSYAFTGNGNVFLSCAVDSFSGVSTEPSLFVEKKASTHISALKYDTFKAEEDFWSGSMADTGSEATCLYNQKAYFDFSEDKLLRAFTDNEFESIKQPLVLSASQINEFSKCPYRWYCRYEYRLEENDFEINMQDYLTLGNILHAVYQEFFQTAGDFGSFGKAENLQILKKIFSKKMASWRNTADRTDEIHLFEIEEKFRDKICEIVSAKNGDKLECFRTDSMEKEFEINRGNLTYKGRIDCIMKSESGEYGVIDFKTSTIDKKSFQLVVYADMLRQSMEYGKLPAVAVFYSVKESEFSSGWKNPEDFTDRLFSLESIEGDFGKRLDKNDFSCTPSNDNCQTCPYTIICRKRYVIK